MWLLCNKFVQHLTYMKKYFLITGLAALAMFSSCKKEFETTAPQKKVTTINELNPSQSFDWSTTKQVTFNVTGQPVPVSIKRLLVVKDADGTVYFNYYHKMSDNLSIKFSLPAYVTKVKVEYGSIVKDVDIQGNIIKFKFSPEIGNED
jgi:pyruvate carboxylase